jgi:hypothetical protein
MEQSNTIETSTFCYKPNQKKSIVAKKQYIYQILTRTDYTDR